MADDRLTEFIEKSLRAGASIPDVQQVLGQAGWSKDQIENGLAHFADLPFIVRVPRPTRQLSARDAFLYLVMFGMLFVSAYHLGNLLFQFINLVYPDAVTDFSMETIMAKIRWSTAALIVAYPIFLFVAMKISKDITIDPMHRSTAVRKWLTYVTLFVAVSVIVGDSVAMIHNLLRGELTIRFILKVLTVALIAGSIFSYYLRTMRHDEVVRR